MAENASKEPRNTAKSPYYWDMMRLLDNARKEGELTDVTLRRLSNWNRRRSLRNRSRMDRAKSRREGATFCGVRLSSISDQYLYTKLMCHELVQANGECKEILMDEIRWRALYSGQQISQQKPRTCLQTHEDAIITCGGLSPDERIRNLAVCYVPATKTWYELAPMLNRRFRHGLASCRGYVYAIGGKGEDSVYNSVERYDPRTNSWGFVAPLPQRVTLMGAVTLQGLLYVTGGIAFSSEHGTVDPFSLNALVSCEVYDITLNEWQSIAPLQVPRFHGSAVLLRDQVYLFGGTGSQSVDRQNSRMVECYDIKSNTWLDAHSMPYNETYFRGCPVSIDQVYLFGGTGSQSVNRQNSRMVECYDIKSNTWLDAHSMPYNDTYFKGC
ncbi:unnamed protein product, partial [Pocillopora meandrina]